MFTQAGLMREHGVARETAQGCRVLVGEGLVYVVQGAELTSQAQLKSQKVQRCRSEMGCDNKVKEYEK